MRVFVFNKAFEQLQRELSRLRFGGMGPQEITQRLTGVVEDWTRMQGWRVWTEYDIPGYTRPHSDVGGRLDVYARFADGTAGVAIEIDRYDRAKSLDKLAFCVAEGDYAVWIRWSQDGLESNLAVPSGVRVIELNASRRAPPSHDRASPSQPVFKDHADRAYAPWSKSEDRKLVALYRGNVEIHQIAQHLGRQRGAINSRLRKLGFL